MKDFDFTEIRAARNMNEANYVFDQHKDAACRQEIHGKFTERVKALFGRVILKEAKL